MTQFVFGAVEFSTFPLAATSMDLQAGTDTASKATMGGMKPVEFTGEGDESIKISALTYPSKFPFVGGLEAVEKLHDLRKTGRRLPLMRGDGHRFGMYFITSIGEAHRELMKDGVGFKVKFSISFQKVPEDSEKDTGLVAELLSLFQVG